MKNTKENKLKFYTINWITFATFLWGPLAGTYLMSKNFENLKQKDYAKKTIKYWIYTTLILFSLLAIIPEKIISVIPDSLIPLAYTITIYTYLFKYQDQDIKKHLKNDWVKYSGWKVTGIALIALIINLTYLFLLILILPENIFG